MANKWQDFDFAEWEEENKKFDQEKYVNETKAIFDKQKDHSFESMMAAMEEISKLEKPPWEPNAYYDSENDILDITLNAEEELTHSHWLNHQITLVLSETDEIVGVKLFGLKKIMGLQ